MAILTVLFSTVAFANYDPHTGRFLTRDPLGVTPADSFNPKMQYKDGANLYLYAKDNPVKMSDGHGLNAQNVNPTPRSDQECCKAATETLKEDEFDKFIALVRRYHPDWSEEKLQQFKESRKNNYAIINPERPTNVVICCDNRKVACASGKLNKWAQQKNLSWSGNFAWFFAYSCVIAHEMRHFYHTSPCPQKCEPYVAPVEPFTDQIQLCEIERQAYQVQLSCLEGAKTLCRLTPDPKECQEIIQAEIDMQRYTFNHHYAPYCKDGEL